MTREEKELLLLDLSARLSYGVKVQYECWDEETEEYIDVIDVLYSINVDKWISVLRTDEEVYIEGIKPYLFPLSSMTEEQKKELYKMGWYLDGDKIYSCFRNYDDANYKTHTDCFELINWCHKNHLDCRYLIEKGLAKDATGLNIY